jgi:hypothetical protein
VLRKDHSSVDIGNAFEDAVNTAVEVDTAPSEFAVPPGRRPLSDGPSTYGQGSHRL